MPDLNVTLNSLAGRFQSVRKPLNHLHPVITETEPGKPTLSKVRCDGREYEVTARFMDSLNRVYGFKDNTLGYCKPPAVIFDVLGENQANKPVRVTFDQEAGEVLGLVPENTPVIRAEDALSVIQNDPRLESVAYNGKGVIEAEFRMNDSWQVKEDSEYHQQIRLRTPVDGLTKPNISLGLIRQICTNGMWTQSNQFRSELALGHNAAIPLARILRSYNNEEGFDALRSRIDAARRTRASLNEVFNLEKTVSNCLLARRRPVVLEQIHSVTGDPCFHYSIESPRSLSAKKRSLLPVECSVLDLANMATELCTHHRPLLSENGQSALMGYVNRLVSSEYDLEEVFDWDKPAEPFYLTKQQLSRN